jgi:hypothetical protein
MIIHSFAKEGISDLGRRKSYVKPTYNGRTWSISPQSIVAYEQRKKTLSLELRKRFERMDNIQDPDPNNPMNLKFQEPQRTVRS